MCKTSYEQISGFGDRLQNIGCILHGVIKELCTCKFYHLSVSEESAGTEVVDVSRQVA